MPKGKDKNAEGPDFFEDKGGRRRIERLGRKKLDRPEEYLEQGEREVSEAKVRGRKWVDDTKSKGGLPEVAQVEEHIIASEKNLDGLFEDLGREIDKIGTGKKAGDPLPPQALEKEKESAEKARAELEREADIIRAAAEEMKNKKDKFRALADQAEKEIVADTIKPMASTMTSSINLKGISSVIAGKLKKAGFKEHYEPSEWLVKEINAANDRFGKRKRAEAGKKEKKPRKAKSEELSRAEEELKKISAELHALFRQYPEEGQGASKEQIEKIEAVEKKRFELKAKVSVYKGMEKLQSVLKACKTEAEAEKAKADILKHQAKNAEDAGIGELFVKTVNEAVRKTSEGLKKEKQLTERGEGLAVKLDTGEKVKLPPDTTLAEFLDKKARGEAVTGAEPAPEMYPTEGLEAKADETKIDLPDGEPLNISAIEEGLLGRGEDFIRKDLKDIHLEEEMPQEKIENGEHAAIYEFLDKEKPEDKVKLDREAVLEEVKAAEPGEAGESKKEPEMAKKEEAEERAEEVRAVEPLETEIGATEKRPDGIKEAGIPAGQTEAFSKLKEYDFTEADKERIQDFFELDKNQQSFVIENLNQVILERVKSEALARYEEKAATFGTAKRLFKNVTKTFELAKLEKEIALRLKGGDEDGYLEGAVNSLSRIARRSEIAEKDGKLEISYIKEKDFSLTPDAAELIAELNSSLNGFSRLPYEWSLSAADKRKYKYNDVARKYEDAKAKILKLKSGPDGKNKKSAHVFLNNIENEVRLHQALNSAPEAEKELGNILKSAPSLRGLANVGTERVAFAAAGAGARYAGVALLGGYFGLPLAAALAGGWASWHRAQKAMRDKERLAAHGKKDKTSEANKMVPAGKLFEKMEGLILKFREAKDRLEEAEDESGRNAYKAELDKYLEEISNRVHYSEEKISKGQIDFGSGEGRLLNQYRLLAQFKDAKDILIINGEPRASNRVKERVDRYAGFLEKKQKKTIAKQVLLGASIGAAAAGAGYAMRQLYEWCDEAAVPETGVEDQPKPEAAGEPASKPASTPEDTLSTEGPEAPGAPAVPEVRTLALDVKAGSKSSIEGELIKHYKAGGMSDKEAGMAAHKELLRHLGEDAEAGAKKLGRIRSARIVMEGDKIKEISDVVYAKPTAAKTPAAEAGELDLGGLFKESKMVVDSQRAMEMQAKLGELGQALDKAVENVSLYSATHGTTERELIELYGKGPMDIEDKFTRDDVGEIIRLRKEIAEETAALAEAEAPAPGPELDSGNGLTESGNDQVGAVSRLSPEDQAAIARIFRDSKDAAAIDKLFGKGKGLNRDLYEGLKASVDDKGNLKINFDVRNNSVDVEMVIDPKGRFYVDGHGLNNWHKDKPVIMDKDSLSDALDFINRRGKYGGNNSAVGRT